MIGPALRRIRHSLRLIRDFTNWNELAALTSQGRHPNRILLRNGIVVESPENNALLAITEEVFVKKVYTPSGFEIHPNDVVVDIGANVGVFSLFAACRTRNAIYAFEPFPESVEFLRKNIRANAISNITVDCCAVSNKNATEKLYLTEITGGHLLFDHNIRGVLGSYIEVPAKTLERAMKDQSIEHVDFLKLDCEGAEGQILEAASRACLETIDRIAMEFHDNVSLLNHVQIGQLLEDAGFRCWLEWSGTSPFGYLYAKRLHPLGR